MLVPRLQMSTQQHYRVGQVAALSGEGSPPLDGGNQEPVENSDNRAWCYLVLCPSSIQCTAGIQLRQGTCVTLPRRMI